MIPTVTLAPGYVIPRLIKGGWQLAGGHGAVRRIVEHKDADAPTRAMASGLP